MKNLTGSFSKSLLIWYILLYIGGITVIYFVPALTHLTGFPLFMIEPMRIFLILSIAHGSKSVTYLLALTLPLFSYVVSGHPEFFKMLIITGELVMNAALFYWLSAKFNRPFPAIILSIIASKTACYLAYWPVFSFTFMISEANTGFLIIQIITTLIFSFYVSRAMKKQFV